MREGAEAALSALDGLVFDVDGVLMDTHGSYPRVIADTTQFYFRRILAGRAAAGDGRPGRARRLITPAETALFKRAGGFNSDWLLTKMAVLYFLAKAAALEMLPAEPGGSSPRPLDLDLVRYALPDLRTFTAEVGRRGGGPEAARAVALEPLSPDARARALAHWDPALIERLGCEHYGGDGGCRAMFGFAPQYRRGPGYYLRERPLLDPARLEGPITRLGLYTGRFRGEVASALEACGLAGRLRPEAMALGDGPHRKPDPGGLFRVAAALGIRRGLFVGDNVDDLRTVQNFAAARRDGDPVFHFAGILGGAPGPRALPIFAEGGADVIAPDVNRLLDVLQERT